MPMTTPSQPTSFEIPSLEEGRSHPQEHIRSMPQIDKVSLEIAAPLSAAREAALNAEKANDDVPVAETVFGKMALSPSARWIGMAGVGLTVIAALVAVGISAPGSMALTLGVFSAGFVALYSLMRGAFWPNSASRNDLPWGDAFDTMPEALFITSRGGRMVFANQAYKDLIAGFGIKRELPLSRVLARDRSLGPILYRLEVAARRGTAAREEINIADPNGVTHHWTIEAKPLKSPTRYVIWRVAERTNQAAIVATPPTFSIDVIAMPAFAISRDGTIQRANAAARSLLGVAEDMVLDGTNLTGFFADLDDLAFLGEIGSTTLLSGSVNLRAEGATAEPVSLWHMMGVEDNIVFCLPSISAEPVAAPLPEGIPTQVAETLTNIMGQAPIAIGVVGADGVLNQANPALEALAGRESLLGVKLEDLVATDNKELIRNLITQEAGDKPDAHTPVPEIIFGDATPGGDNAAKTATAFLAPVGDDGSRIVLAIDITERKKLEVQFHQAQKMQTVGRLAGGIAHDFNNLLTAIIGFCDLLLTRHQVGDPSFADINQIRQNASRAASLTGQLLAFSRRQNLVPRVLNLSDLIADAAALLTRMVGEKIVLNIDHGRDLARIKADEGQVTQVLTNLVLNAKDAMDGEGRISITTSMIGPEDVPGLGFSFIQPADYVLIDVADTGSGIPNDVKAQIFEPFFTTKALGEGTGLGLSTVYGIVKQTGGYVVLDSEVGKGTTFRILLPAYDGDEIASSDEVRQAEAAEQDTTGQGVVLLVEDEAAVRAFSSRALTMRGYTVLEAEDGEDALRVLEEYDGEIDLVVSDVVMPGLDGPGMVERIRADIPDLKVVFMSGYAEDSFRKQLEEAGGEVHFLPKPFSLPQLAGMVKQVIASDADVG